MSITYRTYTQIRFKGGLLWLVLIAFFLGCVEPYEGAVADYEDVLVVNGKLTNEIKRHEVFLTRSYRFEEDGPLPETNAIVRINADDGTEFNFEEISPGVYRSYDSFAAAPNILYTLSINTENGGSYNSEAMKMPTTSKIEKLYAERATNTDGDDGIAIYVDSFDPEAKSRYYHFQYEETYKIIAPYWTKYDLVVINEGVDTSSLNIILREREERICYGQDFEKSIILQTTLGLSEDRLTRYRVRFIKRDNYILTYRYSILVKQFVQNPEAFAYYETLKGLSKSADNIFSEDQPGFLSGNIFAADGSGENVSGFFEVATVEEKRIFFEYEDFYPNEEKPPYKVECFFVAPSGEGTLGNRALFNAIYDDRLRFYDFNLNPTPDIGSGPYLMVRPECGDCTVLGSNKAPDFWIE